MSAWLAVLPIAGVTVLVFFAPGLAITSLAGARGLDRFALAAPVSFALAGLAAVGAEVAGLAFTPLVFAGAAAVVAAATAVVRRTLRHRSWLPLASSAILEDTRSRRRSTGLLTTLAVIIPAAVIAFRFSRAMGSPQHIDQLFDNAFHLNAIALIVADHAGSSLTLGNLTEASRGFYPAALHDIMALVVMGGQFSIVETVNVGAIVISAIVWPLSCLFLGVRLFGARPTPLLMIGILSAAFGAFPYRLISFGVLYPLLAALAMLPVAIGLLIELFGAGRGARPGLPWLAGAALVPVMAGLALTHPSAIVAALLFAAPFIVARAFVTPSEQERRGREAPRGRAALTALYVLFTVVALIVARPDLTTAAWQSFETTPSSIGAVLSSAPIGFDPSWIVSVLVLIGIVSIIRGPRGRWPMLALFVLAGFIYVAAASFSDGFLRDLFTGVWYRDTVRLAALLPVATLPLAATGAMSAIDAATRLVGRRAKNSLSSPPVTDTSPRVRVVCTVVIAGILFPLTQVGQVSHAEYLIFESHAESPRARLISPDERALIDQVRDYVPPDGLVVGNPGTGAGLVFALGDRRALAPHILGTRSPDEQYLLDHWDEAATDPQVCAVIRTLNAFWALDFGSFDALGQDVVIDGLDDLDDPGIRVLAQVGAVRLLKTEECGPVPVS